MLKRLNKDDFSEVEFLGEYPIGKVRYSQDGCPLKVEMEAFSPFIPLNAKDSALPATLFHITIENTTRSPLKASVLGWLENRANGVGGYEEYMAEQARDEDEQSFYRVREGQFLGTPAFVAQVKARQAKQPAAAHDVSLEDIVASTSRALNIPVDLFYTPSRNHQGAWGRSVAGEWGRPAASPIPRSG